MARIYLAALIGILASGSCGGCASTFPTPASPLAAPEAEFNVAPKEMVQVVQQTVTAPPLALTVASADRGVVVTGYQRFPGEWHVARRWQEQTRYKIAVIPDWDQPTAKSRVQVVEETQQRATDGQPWDSGWELNRRDRAEQVLQQIRAAVK